MSTGIIRSGQNADKSEFYSTNVIYSGDNDNDIQYLVGPTFDETQVAGDNIMLRHDDTSGYDDNALLDSMAKPYFVKPDKCPLVTYTDGVYVPSTKKYRVRLKKTRDKNDLEGVVTWFDVTNVIYTGDEYPHLKGDDPNDDWKRYRYGLKLTLNGEYCGVITYVYSLDRFSDEGWGMMADGPFWEWNDPSTWWPSYGFQIFEVDENVAPYRFSSIYEKPTHDDELSRHIGCYYLYKNHKVGYGGDRELYLDPNFTVLATYGDVCNMMPENIRIVYLDQENCVEQQAIHFISSVSMSGEVWLRSADSIDTNPEAFMCGVKQSNMTIVSSYRITPSEYRYNTRMHGSVYNESCVWINGSRQLWGDVNDRILDMYTLWTRDVEEGLYVRSTVAPHTARLAFEYHKDGKVSISGSYLTLASAYDFTSDMRTGDFLTIVIDDFITLYSDVYTYDSTKAPLYSDHECTDVIGYYSRQNQGGGVYIVAIELYDTEIDSSLNGRPTHITVTRDKNKTVDDVVEETVRDLITHSAYNDRYVTTTKYMTMLADPESRLLPPPSFIVNDLDNNFDCGYVMSVTPEEIIYASMRSPGVAKSLTF